MTTAIVRALAVLMARRANAARAITPPSPSLSARMMNSTYLTDTTSVIDQNTNDTAPYTSAAVGWTAPLSIENTVCSAYSGLVPMSPNTIPSAPRTSASPPAGGALVAVCSTSGASVTSHSYQTEGHSAAEGQRGQPHDPADEQAVHRAAAGPAERGQQRRVHGEERGDQSGQGGGEHEPAPAGHDRAEDATQAPAGRDGQQRQEHGREHDQQQRLEVGGEQVTQRRAGAERPLRPREL